MKTRQTTCDICGTIIRENESRAVVQFIQAENSRESHEQKTRQPQFVRTPFGVAAIDYASGYGPEPTEHDICGGCMKRLLDLGSAHRRALMAAGWEEDK
jgi:hypothetical protein